MKSFLSFFILLFLFSPLAKAATGCKVIGGNTIYPTYDTFLLGVLIGGVNIGIPSYIYKPSSPLLTDMSCVIPWVNTYTVTGTCKYGTPEIPVLSLVAVCTNCVDGELVDYTTTVECNLDDHSWLFGAAAGLFGIFIIRKRNKP